MKLFIKLKNIVVDSKFVEVFNQRDKIKKNKLVYDIEFDIKNNVFTISNFSDYKKLIYTIRWLDDVYDYFYKNELNYEFAWIIAKHIEKTNDENVSDGITRFYDIKNEINDAIKHLSLLSKIDESNDYVDIKFIYHERLEYTDVVNLETTRGIINFQVARTKNEKHLYSISWLGELENIKNVRIHYQCETSEIFGSTHCDCREQKNNFMDKMFDENEGMFIYAHEEGRGMGLFNKNNAYFLTQEEGLSTKEAMEKIVGVDEMRNFETPADIIQQKGIKEINLYTNNPRKIIPFKYRGIKVNRKEAWYTVTGKKAIKYIDDKKKYLGHLEK